MKWHPLPSLLQGQGVALRVECFQLGVPCYANLQYKALPVPVHGIRVLGTKNIQIVACLLLFWVPEPFGNGSERALSPELESLHGATGPKTTCFPLPPANKYVSEYLSHNLNSYNTPLYNPIYDPL